MPREYSAGVCFEVVDHLHYKYGLMANHSADVRLLGLGLVAINSHIHLFKDGTLFIHSGYWWDGPSGPAVDTVSFLRASLVHDALYQLMREGKVPQSCRKKADQIMRKIALEDRMSRKRAWWVYWGVRLGAGRAAESK